MNLPKKLVPVAKKISLDPMMPPPTKGMLGHLAHSMVRNAVAHPVTMTLWSVGWANFRVWMVDEWEDLQSNLVKEMAKFHVETS